MYPGAALYDGPATALSDMSLRVCAHHSRRVARLEGLAARRRQSWQDVEPTEIFGQHSRVLLGPQHTLLIGHIPHYGPGPGLLLYASHHVANATTVCCCVARPDGLRRTHAPVDRLGAIDAGTGESGHGAGHLHSPADGASDDGRQPTHARSHPDAGVRINVRAEY
jgi:hypothetical protein